MSVDFDGANKLVVCQTGVTALDVADVYSLWKIWACTSDNAKYLPAMRAVGGDPTVDGRYLGSTFFMTNGWQLRPDEANHTLTVTGNLFADGGGDVFVNTLGAYNVRVVMVVTNLIDTVATGGTSLTTAEHDQLMRALTVGQYLALS